MKKEELSKIIAEYELQNGVEMITEEELLDLIPESDLYPNLYLPKGGIDYYDCINISDYDWHLLQKGFNPFTGEFFEEILGSEYYIMEDIDEIMPYEVAGEFFMCPFDITFEEVKQLAVTMDRVYFIMGSDGGIIDYGFCDVGENFDDFLRIRGFLDDYEYMKVDDPGIDEVEWECALVEDLEYSQSIGTVTVDIYVTDLNELELFLYKPIHETIFRQIIHLNIKDDKFLVVVTLDDQYTIHEVYLELENNGSKNFKSLGWDTYDESVLNIINYYLETGMTLQCYQ